MNSEIVATYKPTARGKPRHATTNGVAGVPSQDPANAGFLQHMRTVHLPALTPVVYLPPVPSDFGHVAEYKQEFSRFRSGNEFVYTDQKCFYAVPEHLFRPTLPPLPIQLSPVVWRCTILHGQRSVHVLPFCDTIFDAQRYHLKLVDRLRSEYHGYLIAMTPIEPRYCYIPDIELQHSPPLIPAPVAANHQARPAMQGQPCYPSGSHMTARHNCKYY